ADALVLRGSVELASERFTDAVETYSKSLELNRENDAAILGLAKAQAAAGRQGEAKKTIEAAVVRFPGTAAFELELALLLLKENEEHAPTQAHAENLLRAAAKHDPNLAEAQYQLGNLALRRGQTTLAIGYLQNAVQISPESAAAHFSLARAFRRAGRAQEAARETALYNKLNERTSVEETSSTKIANPSE